MVESANLRHYAQVPALPFFLVLELESCFCKPSQSVPSCLPLHLLDRDSLRLQRSACCSLPCRFETDASFVHPSHMTSGPDFRISVSLTNCPHSQLTSMAISPRPRKCTSGLGGGNSGEYKWDTRPRKVFRAGKALEDSPEIAAVVVSTEECEPSRRPEESMQSTVGVGWLRNPGQPVRAGGDAVTCVQGRRLGIP